MKGFGIVSSGLQDIAKAEIKQHLGVEADIHGNCLVYEADEKQILKLMYLAKSFYKIGKVISISNKETIDSFENDYAIFLDGEFPKGDFSMATRAASRNSKFKATDLERGVGGTICKLNEYKVDLTNATLNFFVYMDDICMVGIDYSLVDLSKREYKLHNSMNSIKGNLAYAAYQISGAKGTIMDPFCETGTVMIEALLADKNMSPNFYRKNIFGVYRFKELFDFDLLKYFESLDNLNESKNKFIGSDALMKNILFAEKNAKVMGFKEINFTKVSFWDIDIKFDEESIDHIITAPMLSFKKMTEDKVRSRLEEFWERMDYLLSDSGTVTLIVRSMKYFGEPIGFEIEKQQELNIGKETFYIIKCIRD